MSEAGELIENAKRIRQRLRYPPNAVPDTGIDLTRRSTAYKGNEPIPDPPIKKALENPRPAPQPQVDIILPLSFDDIVEAVAAHYDISPVTIKSSDRRSHVCFARFVVVHLSLRLLAKRSLSSIGRDLDKDHTSIIHARDRINAIIAGDAQIAAEIQAVGDYIETVHNDRLAMATVCQSGVEVQPGAGSPGQEIHELGG